MTMTLRLMYFQKYMYIHINTIVSCCVQLFDGRKKRVILNIENLPLAESHSTRETSSEQVSATNYVTGMYRSTNRATFDKGSVRPRKRILRNPTLYGSACFENRFASVNGEKSRSGKFGGAGKYSRY